MKTLNKCICKPGVLSIKLKKNMVLFLSFVCCFCSCQRIENGKSLSTKEIKRIKDLGLLDDNEHIIKFYSTLKKSVTGNFFTNKRIAFYWINESDTSKKDISFAYYHNILSIDTIYYAGLTYSPYMLITTKDNNNFKVCADGKKEQIKSFFEEAINFWNKNK